MKKTLKIFLWGIVTFIIAIVGGFIFWASNPLGPGEQALSALESDASVNVEITDDWIAFQPVDAEPRTGFIFYPGGRVDYRSYAPALHKIAAQGYLVVLVPAPLNMMVFNIDAAQPVIDHFSEITYWAIGGHSLGGAMAANFVYTNPAAADALVLWASYPAESNDLTDSGLKVLSLYGTLDMAGEEAFTASRSLLPEDTTWVIIKGGNHAQLGDYGAQPGDNPATISAAEQQAQAAQATVEFLALLGE